MVVGVLKSATVTVWVKENAPVDDCGRTSRHPVDADADRGRVAVGRPADRPLDGEAVDRRGEGVEMG
jgi:hypothetical protein